ncbi:MAG: hypothetical protein GY851_01500 [bacterium]|nr:hypothetical protein [bacterium]
MGVDHRERERFYLTARFKVSPVSPDPLQDLLQDNTTGAEWGTRMYWISLAIGVGGAAES